MLDNPRLCEKYRIEEFIGHGSFSVVYRAHELLCDRRVAIKALQRDAYEEGSDHYASSEVSALARIWEHPNVVSMHTVEPGDDVYVAYLVMEFIDGGSLMDRICDGGLPLAEALALSYDICSGITHAHAQNVVHRDIKPRNVLLTRDGVAKVSDFGVAQVKEERHDYATTFAGTRRYMAPEQYEGVYDHRVDIFAAGILLWEMATGVYPYPGESQEEVRAAKERPMSPPDALPDPVREILDASLRPRPFERYRSMDAMRDALERVLIEDYEQVVLDGLTDRKRSTRSSPSADDGSLRRLTPASARCLEQLVTHRFRDALTRRETRSAKHNAADCATSMALRVCRGDFDAVDAGLEQLAASGAIGEEVLELLAVTVDQLRTARESGKSVASKRGKTRLAKPAPLTPSVPSAVDGVEDETVAHAWRQEGRRQEEGGQGRKARSAYRRSGKAFVHRAAELRKAGENVSAARLYHDAGESHRLAGDVRRSQDSYLRAAESWVAEAERHGRGSARELAADASRSAARAYEQAQSPDLARARYEAASAFLYDEAVEHAALDLSGPAESLCRSAVELAVHANNWALAEKGRRLIDDLRRRRTPQIVDATNPA